MFCRYCGTANPSDSRFCGICGKRLDETTTILAPDSVIPIQPIPGLPMGGVQSIADNVPIVQETPQISNVPIVQGTPSPFGGHSTAASSAPLSSPAPQEALHTPYTSAPSLPPHTPSSSQIEYSGVTHPLPESPMHAYHPLSPHAHPHPHVEQHPHTEHHSHPRIEHHLHTQPITESQSRSTSLQSTASQQALSTGVTVAGRMSRRALLIALGGAAAVTVGVGTVVYVNNAISTPEKTITTFLEAVKGRDGQTAYDQLSSRLQSQVDRQQYISNINLVGGFIGSYTISNVQ